MRTTFTVYKDPYMNAAMDLAARLQRPLAESTSVPVIYVVRPGDTLSHIVQQFYDLPPGAQGHAAAIAAVRYFNPAIVDGNYLVPGQILRLLPLPVGNALASCPVPTDFQHTLTSTPLRHHREPVDSRYVNQFAAQIPQEPAQRDLFWALAQLQDNYNWLATPTGIGLTSFGHLVGPANAALLQQIGSQHALFHQGKFSKGQYLHTSRKLLRQFADNVGPIEKFLFKGKSTHDAIRISRVRGIPATQNVITHVAKMNQLAKLAKNGGVLLTGAGLYMGCRDISKANTSLEKNEILVETVISTAAGSLIGLGITLVLATNPISWGMALVLATGSATASFAAGKFSRHFYDKAYNQYDLTTALGVDNLCR